MTDQTITAEFTIARPDGEYTSLNVTRTTEREAVADLWRLIHHIVEHATGTARGSETSEEARTDA